MVHKLKKRQGINYTPKFLAHMHNFVYYSSEDDFETSKVIKSADCLVLGKDCLWNNLDRLKYGMVADVIAHETSQTLPKEFASVF